VSTDEDPTIADNERSPAADAADQVEFGPEALNEQDQRKPEPEGTADLPEKAEGDPTVAPARSHH
jgi:hypothetical protein